MFIFIFVGFLRNLMSPSQGAFPSLDLEGVSLRAACFVCGEVSEWAPLAGELRASGAQLPPPPQLLSSSSLSLLLASFCLSFPFSDDPSRFS